MRFASWLENTEYEQMIADFLKREPEYLANPAIKQELETTGTLTIRTVSKALGIAEGPANFIVRELLKRHANPQKQQAYDLSRRVPDTDDFYYHVTLKKNLRAIMSRGLSPDSTPMFTNYTNHSAGKVFLCEKNGVNFWKERVESHAFHNTGRELLLVVLRIPKKAVQQVFDDPVGKQDSNYPSYYTTQVIPPQYIQLVK